MAAQNNPQNQQTNLSKLTAEGLKWAEIQDRVNSGLSSYLDEIGKLNELTKSLNRIKEQERKISAEISSLANATTKEEKERLKILQDRKAVIDYNYEAYKKEAKILKEVLKDAEKINMTLGAAGAALGKGLVNLPKSFMNILGSLKDLFEMDKSIRIASRDMGVLSKGSAEFRKNIEKTSFKTVGFGVGIKELAELQSTYSELVGRNVMMNEGALENLSAMGKATQLGIEGAAQMAAEFDSQGLSAEKTASFVQETLDNSSKMGLNATKVMKNISGNIKMLNRYRFKDGAKGLAKMAETVTKLGVGMNFVGGMADKLFDLEPAIEMSAQLQVMGGAWADMADPFKLMYMARNDVNALTETVANAAKESMSFAKDGSIETTAEAMHKLRIVAQQTGLEYDDLMEAGKKAFKMGQIKAKVFGVDDETKEFIANTAEFKDGKATITIDGQPKLLSMLNSADKGRLKEMVKEKQTMKERADAAQSFDEKITNLINMVKISMMPIVEGLTEVLDPLVKDLMDPSGKFKKDLVELGKNIGDFVKWAAKGLKWFVENVVDIFGAKGIFLTYLLGKSAAWIANGFLLAQGFNMGTKGLSGMFGGGKNAVNMQRHAAGTVINGKKVGGQMYNAGSTKTGMGTGAKIGSGIGLGVAGMGLDYGRSKMDNPESTGGKWLGVGSSALKGAGMGMMFGPWGAAIGGVLGAAYGAYDEFISKGEEANQNAQTMDDGIIQFNKDDKFTKVDDSTMIAGTNKNGNKDLAQVLKYGMLAANPLMGGLMGSLMGGSNSATSAGTANKIEFGELVISGEIKINLPGGTQIGAELIKSQEFKSAITRIVSNQLEKNINGGKNKG